MAYIGDIRLGDTVDLKFTTRSFTTGAPTTLAGTPVISAYVGNSTTQLTAGITLTVDFDAVTGLHNVRVVATSGNGYATASNYDLVITTGTVGGVSVVGEAIGSFSIEARSALMPTTAARTLDVSSTGEAGLDWANVGSPTTTLALTGTTIAATQKVDVDTIKTNPVVNAGTITFPTTATLASTTNITAGTITTATNVTTVNGLAANVITAAATATDFGTEVAAAVWNSDATTYQTQGTFGQAIGDPVADTNSIYKAVVTDATGATVGVDVVDLKTQIGTAGAGLSNIGTIATCTNLTNAPTNGDFTATMKTSITTAATAATPTAGLSAAAVDLIWDEATSGHATAGTTGKALTDAGSAGDPWSTAIPGAYSAGTAGNILGNRLVGTIATGTHNPQSGDAYARLGAPAGASVSADVAAVKSDTAATLLDTGTDGVVVASASKTGYSLTATTGLGNQTSNITGNLSGSVGSVTGSVGSVTSGVTVTTNNDKSGYSLTATTGLGNQTSNITGNLSGSVGSVTGSVGSVTGAVGSVTGLTASDVGAIKAKTDSLTFTQAGHVDANVQRINDVVITGDGGITPFNVV